MLITYERQAVSEGLATEIRTIGTVNLGYRDTRSTAEDFGLSLMNHLGKGLDAK